MLFLLFLLLVLFTLCILCLPMAKTSFDKELSDKEQEAFLQAYKDKNSKSSS